MKVVNYVFKPAKKPQLLSFWLHHTAQTDRICLHLVAKRVISNLFGGHRWKQWCSDLQKKKKTQQSWAVLVRRQLQLPAVFPALCEDGMSNRYFEIRRESGHGGNFIPSGRQLPRTPPFQDVKRCLDFDVEDSSRDCENVEVRYFTAALHQTIPARCRTTWNHLSAGRNKRPRWEWVEPDIWGRRCWDENRWRHCRSRSDNVLWWK